MIRSSKTKDLSHHNTFEYDDADFIEYKSNCDKCEESRLDSSNTVSVK